MASLVHYMLVYIYCLSESDDIRRISIQIALALFSRIKMPLHSHFEGPDIIKAEILKSFHERFCGTVGSAGRSRAQFARVRLMAHLLTPKHNSTVTTYGFHSR
jgi:hypothetical protein